MDEWMDGCMDVCMHGCMYACMCLCMSGCCAVLCCFVLSQVGDTRWLSHDAATTSIHRMLPALVIAVIESQFIPSQTAATAAGLAKLISCSRFILTLCMFCDLMPLLTTLYMFGQRLTCDFTTFLNARTATVSAIAAQLDTPGKHVKSAAVLAGRVNSLAHARARALLDRCEQVQPVSGSALPAQRAAAAVRPQRDDPVDDEEPQDASIDERHEENDVPERKHEQGEEGIDEQQGEKEDALDVQHEQREEAATVVEQEGENVEVPDEVPNEQHELQEEAAVTAEQQQHDSGLASRAGLSLPERVVRAAGDTSASRSRRMRRPRSGMKARDWHADAQEHQDLAIASALSLSMEKVKGREELEMEKQQEKLRKEEESKAKEEERKKRKAEKEKEKTEKKKRKIAELKKSIEEDKEKQKRKAAQTAKEREELAAKQKKEREEEISRREREKRKSDEIVTNNAESLDYVIDRATNMANTVAQLQAVDVAPDELAQQEFESKVRRPFTASLRDKVQERVGEDGDTISALDKLLNPSKISGRVDPNYALDAYDVLRKQYGVSKNGLAPPVDVDKLEKHDIPLYHEFVRADKARAEAAVAEAKRAVSGEAQAERVPMFEMLKRFLQSPFAFTCPDLCMLAEIVWCMPISTAAVERVFSFMNNIKRKKRNRLSWQILDVLLLICIEGPPQNQFDFRRAVLHWYHKKYRRAHL
jgi:hypothetical protein